ncbi:hypothetical protein [Pseudoruegeria sp. HB172150]|uniref:hypothetical protein n=1 Tax=Pseudoruegeria sp. HB172150 TaxID=2721164 RepID=UPI001554DCD7|nr:hypothetical protein [Pseudoruegeria sp. HB172150]
MGNNATGIAVGDLIGVIRGPALSAAERRELHQRVPGLSFGPVTGSTGADTDIRLGQITVARPAPGAHCALRRAVNAALTVEALHHGMLMLHGAVVARGTEALLILGDYNAGKTRLALALASWGFAGLAGDLALIGVDGSVHGGTRAVLMKWPVDDLGMSLPPSDLGLPKGAMRWQAPECPGGPYPGCCVTQTVLLTAPGALGPHCEPDLAYALRAAVLRSRRRVIRDDDWQVMLQRHPEIAATQESLIRSLAARVTMLCIANDFPSCVEQILSLLGKKPSVFAREI